MRAQLTHHIPQFFIFKDNTAESHATFERMLLLCDEQVLLARPSTFCTSCAAAPDGKRPPDVDALRRDGAAWHIDWDGWTPGWRKGVINPDVVHSAAGACRACVRLLARSSHPRPPLATPQSTARGKSGSRARGRRARG